ncbi:MAG: hypothetical protein HZB67_01385 [Candidatus Aenigmarchaeota archaeon]|nr:hypothetical protein [Candidatus Aenigmarchaeota archaeon]
MKHKLREWARRYLPAEIIGIIAGILAAIFSFGLTGNRIVTAYAGTWGENLGYYGYMSGRDVRVSRRRHKEVNKRYDLTSFAKNIRNLLLEFGPSEIFDSFLIRPFFMYAFPLLVGNLPLGILIATVVANITFYTPVIVIYELRKKHQD